MPQDPFVTTYGIPPLDLSNQQDSFVTTYGRSSAPSVPNYGAPEPSWAQTIIGTGLQVVPTVIGGFLGGFEGGIGAVPGSMAGSGIGSYLRQLYEEGQTDKYGRPLRSEINPYVIGLDTALGGLGGFAKVPEAGLSAGIGELAKYGVRAGAEGALISGASAPFYSMAEGGGFDYSPSTIGKSMLAGGLMAPPLGLGIHGIANRMNARPEEPPLPTEATPPPPTGANLATRPLTTPGNENLYVSDAFPPQNLTQPGLPNAVPFGGPAGPSPFTTPIPERVPPQAQQRQAFAAMDAQVQQQVFELRMQQSEALRGGDQATSAQIEAEILRMLTDHSVAKRNWQPTIPEPAVTPYPPTQPEPNMFAGGVEGVTQPTMTVPFRDARGRIVPRDVGPNEVSQPFFAEQRPTAAQPDTELVSSILNEENPQAQAAAMGELSQRTQTPPPVGELRQVPTTQLVDMLGDPATAEAAQAEIMRRLAPVRKDPSQNQNVVKIAEGQYQINAPGSPEHQALLNQGYERGPIVGGKPTVVGPGYTPREPTAFEKAMRAQSSTARRGALQPGQMVAGKELRVPKEIVNDQYLANAKKGGYEKVGETATEVILRRVEDERTPSAVPGGDHSPEVLNILRRFYGPNKNVDPVDANRIKAILSETDLKTLDAMNKVYHEEFMKTGDQKWADLADLADARHSQKFAEGEKPEDIRSEINYFKDLRDQAYDEGDVQRAAELAGHIQDLEQRLNRAEGKDAYGQKPGPMPPELQQAMDILDKTRINKILKDLDYLGFDTLGQAKAAIRQHDDWAQRWDVPDPEIVKEIEAWKAKQPYPKPSEWSKLKDSINSRDTEAIRAELDHWMDERLNANEGRDFEGASQAHEKVKELEKELRASEAREQQALERGAALSSTLRKMTDAGLQDELDALGQLPDYNDPAVVNRIRAVEAEINRRQEAKHEQIRKDLFEKLGRRPTGQEFREALTGQKEGRDWEKLLPTGKGDDFRQLLTQMRAIILNPHIDKSLLNPKIEEIRQRIINTEDPHTLALYRDYFDHLDELGHYSDTEKQINDFMRKLTVSEIGLRNRNARDPNRLIDFMAPDGRIVKVPANVAKDRVMMRYQTEDGIVDIARVDDRDYQKSTALVKYEPKKSKVVRGNVRSREDEHWDVMARNTAKYEGRNINDVETPLTKEQQLISDSYKKMRAFQDEYSQWFSEQEEKLPPDELFKPPADVEKAYKAKLEEMQDAHEKLVVKLSGPFEKGPLPDISTKDYRVEQRMPPDRANREDIVRKFQEKLPDSRHWERTHFLLPDGTQKVHGKATHEAGARDEVGVNLHDAKRAGIIRTDGFEGAEIHALITQKQSEVLADSLHYTGRDHILIEVYDDDMRHSYKKFYKDVTGGDIYDWVNSKYKERNPSLIDKVKDFLQNQIDNFSWNRMISLAKGRKEIALDSHEYLTKEEIKALRNNPRFQQLNNLWDAMVHHLIEISDSPEVNKIVTRTGTTLDPGAYAVHVRNPREGLHAVMANFPAIIARSKTPEEAASRILASLYHELGHTPIARMVGKESGYIVEDVAQHDPVVSDLLDHWFDANPDPLNIDPSHTVEWLEKAAGVYERAGAERHREMHNAFRSALEAEDGSFHPEIQEILSVDQGLRRSRGSKGNDRSGEVTKQAIGPTDETPPPTGDELPGEDITPTKTGIRERMGWGQGYTPSTKKVDPNAPNWAREGINLFTNAATIDDMSAPGRQGLSQIFTKEFWQALAATRHGLTEKGFDMVDNQLRELETFQPKFDAATGNVLPSNADEAGLQLMKPGHKAGPREEATASRWIETGGNIPVFSTLYRYTAGVPARASNRMYTLFLNKLRATRFQNLMDLGRNMAIRGEETGRTAMPGILGGIQFQSGRNLGFTRAVTPDQAANMNPYHNKMLAKEMADFVNTATGRGPLRTHYLPIRGAEINLEGSAKVLSSVLFAPRNTASKTRMMNPNTYIMASPFVRKQYLKAAVSTAAAWFSFAQLAKMADPNVEVGDDPTSADFGKVRIGDFRLDPAGGFQQFLVMYARLYQGGESSSSTGQFHRFGEGFQAPTQFEMGERFLANKLNPIAKFAYDLATSTQYNPFHLTDRTVQLFIPLIVQDYYDLMKEDPNLMMPWAVPILFGAGSQIYSKGESISKIIPPEYDTMVTGGGLIDAMPQGVKSLWDRSGRY